MPSPEERLRLLDPAQDPNPPRQWPHEEAREVLFAWEARADARLARIRELEAERDLAHDEYCACEAECDALRSAVQADLDALRAAASYVCGEADIFLSGGAPDEDVLWSCISDWHVRLDGALAACAAANGEPTPRERALEEALRDFLTAFAAPARTFDAKLSAAAAKARAALARKEPDA